MLATWLPRPPTDGQFTLNIKHKILLINATYICSTNEEERQEIRLWLAVRLSVEAKVNFYTIMPEGCSEAYGRP